MKLRNFVILASILLVIDVYAVIPSGYYDSAEGKKSGKRCNK